MRSYPLVIFFIFIFASHLCFCETGDSLNLRKSKQSTTFFTASQFEYSDSLTSVDNSLTGFQNYIYRNHLGNAGLAFSDLQFRVFFSDAGFRFSKNNFDNYFYTKSNLLFFDSHTPFTDLLYIIGSKKEQDFKMTFSYNVKKNWNIAVNFLRIRSEGFYLNQSTNNNFISVSSNYRSINNRYKLLVGVMYNYMQYAENGGIADDSLFENSRNTDKKLFDVNLSSAKGSALNRSVFFSQYLNFGKRATDSSSSILPQSYLKLETSFDDRLLKYEDEVPLSGFYSNVYYDSLRTYDSTYSLNFENELSWKIVDNGLRRGLRDIIGIEVSIKHQFIKIKQRTVDAVYNNVILGGSLYNTYPFYGVQSKIAVKYVFEGYNKDDYSIVGNLKKDISNVLSSIDLSVSSNLHMPDFIYQRYSSNHFEWSNDFYQIRENKASISFSMIKYRLKTGVSYTDYENSVYFDNYAIARQYNGHISIMAAYIKKNFKLKNWHLDNSLLYQHVPDSKVIRLPDFILEHSLYYENKLFKGEMTMQIGASLFYFSEYYANSYMPATTQFYLQNDKKYGNYPFVDFFINARVKAVRIFFKIDHTNNGLSGSKYMNTPNYPYNDRAFKLGISWRFYD